MVKGLRCFTQTRFFSTQVRPYEAKKTKVQIVKKESKERGSKAESFAHSVERKLGLRDVEDWYALSRHQVQKIFGLSFRFAHFKRFLRKVYPDHKWDDHRFLYPYKLTRQKQLERVVQKLFPNVFIIRNARKGAYILNKETNNYLEIDVWIPSLRLGFEYQDPHHYVATSRDRYSLDEYQHRDSMKKQILSDRGDTLIEVPCWWDGSEESLAATVHAIRDDLFPNANGDPIHFSPPPNFLEAIYLVPGVGELMLSTHLSSFLTPQEVVNWWMSEQYDGIRACWNPRNRTLYSRIGAVIPVPSSFLQNIPGMFLDGELWLGRGSFLQVSKLLSRTLSSSALESLFDWSFFRYLLLDNPDPSFHLLPFETRFSSLLDPQSPPSSRNIPHFNSQPLSSKSFVDCLTFCEIVAQTKCSNFVHFKTWFSQVSENSGEGLVLREPESTYTQGRSDSWRSAKTVRDAHAKIVAIVRRESEVLAENTHVYSCVLADGVYIECVAQPGAGLDPCVGDIVCFRYTRLQHYTRLPLLPEIYCIRHDLTWEDILYGSAPLPQKNVRWNKSESVIQKVTRGFWKDPTNHRVFFDEYAKKKGFDPLNANNWYNISYAKFVAAGWVGSSCRLALINAYPEIAFDPSNFVPKTPMYWKNQKNVREFFVSVARKLNIDPLLPSSWYKISTTAIARAGGGAMLNFFSYSLRDALKFAFPELKFDRHEFSRVERNFWSKWENYRMFFDKFAKQNGFDPLIPENWYSVTRRQILKAGGRPTMYSTGESHRLAIAAAYPEINLVLENFHNLNKHTNGKKTKDKNNNNNKNSLY